jgi:hypothetical protein
MDIPDMLRDIGGGGLPMEQAAPDPARAEILSLRARIVALERATLASLELALLIRPDELKTNLEKARRSLETSYEDEDFASDVTDATERFFLAREVDRLIRAIQSEMGFAEGKAAPESG